MKKSSLLYVVVFLLIFVGCAKDPAKPVITLHELGENNSGSVFQGTDLHIDAEVEAEAGIDIIILEIHYEGTGTGWEYEMEYTEYMGLKNTDFHKHIDVPVDATPGDYHFHLKVRDQEGQQTTKETELLVKQS
jgi:hypothetical protein